MKLKHQKYINNELYPQGSPEKVQTKSIKSPSPDKKQANIITPTRSPEMAEVKRSLTPPRILIQKSFDRESVLRNNEGNSYNTNNKHQDHTLSTNYFTSNQKEREEMTVSQKLKLETASQHNKEFQQSLGGLQLGEFDIGNIEGDYDDSGLSSSRKKYTWTVTELDYIKLLQQKERTIKDLHEIIEMINKNSTIDFSHSDHSHLLIDGSSDHGNFFENTDRGERLNYTSRSNEKRQFRGQRRESGGSSLDYQRQLKMQIRTLIIENQQLINMIEKIKRNQEQKGEILSAEQLQSTIRNEEAIYREIKELRSALNFKDDAHGHIKKHNQDLELRVQNLEDENARLINLLKLKNNREMETISFSGENIGSESVSQSRLSNQRIQIKEKLSLVKIKEQYNESLRAFQKTVYCEIENMIDVMQTEIQQLNSKVNSLEIKVESLQKFKSAYQKVNPQETSKELSRSQIQSEVLKGQQEKIKAFQVECEARVRKIISSEYEEVLQKQSQEQKELKKGVEALQKQLIELQGQYSSLQVEKKQLQRNLQQMSQRIEELQRRKKQDSRNQSPKSNYQEIQEINYVKTKDIQIQKLRQLIKKYENQHERQTKALESKIVNLKDEALDFQGQIQEQDQILKNLKSELQQYKQKAENQQISQQKPKFSPESVNNSESASEIRSEIDHLTNFDREAVNHQHKVQNFTFSKTVDLRSIPISAIQEQDQSCRLNLQYRIVSLQRQVYERDQLLGRKQDEIHGIKDDMEQKFSKLITNYSKEIEILKNQIERESAKRVYEISEKNIQIDRLLQQSENAKKMMNSKFQHDLQQLSVQVKDLELELDLKSKENLSLNKKMGSLKGSLRQEMEIEKAEAVAQLQKELIRLHGQAETLREQLNRMEARIEDRDRTISRQNENIKEQTDIGHRLADRIQELEAKVEEYREAEREIQQLHKTVDDMERSSLEKLKEKEASLEQLERKCQEVKAASDTKEESLFRKNEELVGEILDLRTKSQQMECELSRIVGEEDLMAELQELKRRIGFDMGAQGERGQTVALSSSRSVSTSPQQFNSECYQDYRRLVDERGKFERENQALSDQLIEQESEKVGLLEKVNFLEKSIRVHVNQLQSRKQITEKLISDKAEIETKLALAREQVLKYQQSFQNKEQLLRQVQLLIKLESERKTGLSCLLRSGRVEQS